MPPRTPGPRLRLEPAQLGRISREYETHNQRRPHRSLNAAAPPKPLPEPIDLDHYRVRGAGSHPWPDQRISPGRMTRTRFSACTMQDMLRQGENQPPAHSPDRDRWSRWSREIRLVRCGCVRSSRQARSRAANGYYVELGSGARRPDRRRCQLSVLRQLVKHQRAFGEHLDGKYSVAYAPGCRMIRVRSYMSLSGRLLAIFARTRSGFAVAGRTYRTAPLDPL